MAYDCTAMHRSVVVVSWRYLADSANYYDVFDMLMTGSTVTAGFR